MICCPKCSCKVFKPFVDGFELCTNCGMLRYPAFIPKMQFNPQAKKSNYTADTVSELIDKNIKALCKYYKNNRSWYKTTNWLWSLTGVKINEKTLQKRVEKSLNMEGLKSAT